MYILPEVDLYKRAERKTVLDLPTKTLARMAVRLNLIGALVWDYADTVRELAQQMKLRELRAVSRTIRQLRTDYDRLRSHDLDSTSVKTEWHLAQLFEQVCSGHLSKLSYSLHNEKEIGECREDYRYLVVAVQMAMTALDAMRLYADECDRFIRQGGVNGHSIMCDQFLKLAKLLPQYAGDAYNPKSPSRKLTAKILYNELRQIELYDNDRTDDV